MRIEILKSKWDGLTDSQRADIRQIPNKLILGEPATFKDNGEVWVVFDDGRFIPDDVAYLATAIKKPNLNKTKRKAATNLSWRVDEYTLDDVIAAQGTTDIRAS